MALSFEPLMLFHIIYWMSDTSYNCYKHKYIPTIDKGKRIHGKDLSTEFEWKHAKRQHTEITTNTVGISMIVDEACKFFAAIFPGNVLLMMIYAANQSQFCISCMPIPLQPRQDVLCSEHSEPTLHWCQPFQGSASRF